MTAAGDQVIAEAYRWVGTVESPQGSNCVVFWEPFTGGSPCGYGAWCAAYVSDICQRAGYPLPPIDADAGFMLCSNGQIAAYTTGHAVDINDAEPGTELIFSWEPWYLDGIAYCAYGVYAGAPAGDHTGFLAERWGGGTLVTVEGNTSDTAGGSWDNGGGVWERRDRYPDQICCFAFHEALRDGTTPGDDEMTDADFDRIRGIVHDEVLNVWRAQEMANLDTDRAQQGAHQAGVGLMRSDEFKAIIADASS